MPVLAAGAPCRLPTVFKLEVLAWTFWLPPVHSALLPSYFTWVLGALGRDMEI